MLTSLLVLSINSLSKFALMKKAWLIVLLIVMNSFSGASQCAMCRTTLENNVSNGEVGIAAGINFGIMYLFFAPYVLIGLVAFFWYRNSKKHVRELEVQSRIRRKVSTLP